VIVQPPVYPPFFQVIQKNQRVVVENNLINEDGQYRMDFDDLEKKIKDGAKAIILCSPHNPVGRVWDRETLEKLGNLCIEHGVLIISDEIHSDLVFESSHHTPIASLSETIKNNTITLMAPSKTFNIAGLAASYAIVPNNELRQKCVAELEAMAVSTTTIFSTLGLTTTYTHGGKWLDQLMPYVEENSHYAVDYIEKNIPQVKAYVPDGTYLLWLDFSELGKDQQSVQEALIQIGKVALNSGSDYGQVGDGFFRLNIGCSREVLKEGLERIKKAVVYLTE
jgi:cystathionine beta-lyase